MQKYFKEQRNLKKQLRKLQRRAIERGLNGVLLRQLNYISNYKQEIAIKRSKKKLIVAIVLSFVLLVLSVSFANSIIGARCLLPSNYVVWEATRPLANCAYCVNITKPIILRNVTRREFASYAYSPGPIIIKNAILHWRATKVFNYKFFKKLYERTKGSYETLEDDGCQFLNFKTDLFSLKEVFSISEARIKNEPGEKPWYVGWGNCHPDILAKVRQYYSPPDFLPQDAEFPATENIFFGYEMGAVMHLDYIARLMWQGQVKGNKTWTVAPVLECEHICDKFDFYVEAGDVEQREIFHIVVQSVLNNEGKIFFLDAPGGTGKTYLTKAILAEFRRQVILDTRIWYHATSIPKGQFSLTVQSEYG